MRVNVIDNGKKNKKNYTWFSIGYDALSTLHMCKKICMFMILADVWLCIVVSL